MSRQGYYKFLERSSKDQSDKKILKQKVIECRRYMPRLGTRKIYHIIKPELNKKGIKCGRDKLFDFMRRECLLVKKRKYRKITTRSYKRFHQHPNRIKDMEIKRPEQAWVTDITYVRTKEGYLYLSLVTDAYSKKIMGYELSENMKVESSLNALDKSLKHRKYPNRKLVHHSDRGFQNCRFDYTSALLKNNIKISMTTKYDPYENAIAERINGILKDELYISNSRLSMAETRKVVEHSINIYNEKRPHLSCEYMTPNQAHTNGRFKL